MKSYSSSIEYTQYRIVAPGTAAFKMDSSTAFNAHSTSTTCAAGQNPDINVRFERIKWVLLS